MSTSSWMFGALLLFLGTAASAQTHPCPPQWHPRFNVDATLYPYAHQCFKTAVGMMHFLDEGPQDTAQTLVLVHGGGTWSALFRQVVQEGIAHGYRVIAPDLIGHGLSARPSAQAFPYTASAQARILEQFLLGLDVRGVTLVLHEWGGPLGLWFAERHPDRVSRVVLSNTWAWAVSARNPGDYAWLVNASKLAHWNQASYIADCTLPRKVSSTIAASVDPTGGALAQSVLHLYLDAWIDPTTGAPYTSDACTAPTVLAEGILDEAGWLYSVEAGLGALQAAPQFYVFGRNDPLFGDRRCDISGSSATCPNGDLCVCNANYLTPDQSCANAPSSAPNAWICSDPVTQRAIMPAIDRFTSDLENQSLVGQSPLDQCLQFDVLLDRLRRHRTLAL